jgi:hypothetical protein
MKGAYQLRSSGIGTRSINSNKGSEDTSRKMVRIESGGNRGGSSKLDHESSGGMMAGIGRVDYLEGTKQGNDGEKKTHGLDRLGRLGDSDPQGNSIKNNGGIKGSDGITNGLDGGVHMDTKKRENRSTSTMEGAYHLRSQQEEGLAALKALEEASEATEAAPHMEAKITSPKMEQLKEMTEPTRTIKEGPRDSTKEPPQIEDLIENSMKDSMKEKRALEATKMVIRNATKEPKE